VRDLVRVEVVRVLVVGGGVEVSGVVLGGEG
jgi:hypothetical protein